MKKLLFLILFSLLLILPSCGGNLMINSQKDAAAYSKEHKKLVLYKGVIYKNGNKYGYYQVSKDGVDELITYKSSDNKVVATMELKGVSPQSALLKLASGNDIKLYKREMETEVDKKDGALYLIKEMILTEESKTESNTKEFVEKKTDVKFENNEANGKSNQKNNMPNVEIKENKNGKIVDLRYGFKKGWKLHYKSVDTTTMKFSMDTGMSGMDMGAMPLASSINKNEFKVKTETDFTIIIKSVNADRSANFEIIINDFKMFSLPDGSLIASSEDMKGLKAEGVITDKGEVKFLEDIFVVKTEKGETMLVTTSVKEKKQNSQYGVGSSAWAGDEKVELQATYDPKTGKLTASAKLTKRKPNKKVVKITKEDKKVDILPKSLMRMFLLPKDPLKLGDEIKFSAPLMLVRFTGKQGKKEPCLILKAKYMTDKNNVPEGTEKDALNMYPQTDAKIKMKFNYKKGCLKEIEGVINSTLNIQGFKNEIHSEILMKKMDE